MIDLIKTVIKREYSVLNKIEISQNALLNNYQYLSELSSDIKIAPVLKSNAYGHGLEEISKILDSRHAPFFCVDSLHEAYDLYKARVKTPVLIMGYFNPDNLRFKKLPFAFTVWDIKSAQAIDKYQKGAKIHIKVDTGMHRLGVPIDQLDSFLKELKKCKNIKVDGVMSHLASAYGLDDPLFTLQLENFKKASVIIDKNRLYPSWKHISASQALINQDTRAEVAKVCNLARTGICLYGIANVKNLQPVLKLKTKIAQVKAVRKGDAVGYDGTFRASKDLTLGILPIGYNDGVDRRLSNKGAVIIDGVVCPIVGRVSMNITAVDISNVETPRTNQEVIVISENPKDPNSIENISRICGTIPHEILIHLIGTTKREIKS